MRVASVSPRGDGPWPERVDHGGGPAPLGTFRRCSGIEGPRARRLLAEVEAWLASDASDWPFAFVSVCETLGLDPDYIRRGIRQWAARRKAVAEQIPSRRQSESTGCRQIAAPRAVA